MKINLRESLGRLDLLTDNKYDLRNTYDCSNISNDKKKKLAESISNNASAKQIYNILNEDIKDYDWRYWMIDSKYEANAYFYNSHSMSNNYTGLADDLYTDDFEEVKDWTWEKVQHGLFVSVIDRENGNEVNINPENYDFESDDAYRVFDDLDELSPLHESLNEEDNFNSDEYERKHILRLAKSVEEASKRKGINISNLKKTAKKYIENHKDTKHKKELDKLIKVYKSLDEKEECLEEDTVKQNGKWVNKGKEGTHGKFKTKKAADAQRKAMFANGYKGESLKEDAEDDFNSEFDERHDVVSYYSIKQNVLHKDLEEVAKVMVKDWESDCTREECLEVISEICNDPDSWNSTYSSIEESCLQRISNFGHEENRKLLNGGPYENREEMSDILYTICSNMRGTHESLEESVEEDYDEKKSVEFADYWVWAKTKDGKWKMYDAVSSEEDVKDSLRQAKADKRFVDAKVTKNGERPDGKWKYSVLTSEGLNEDWPDDLEGDLFVVKNGNKYLTEKGKKFYINEIKEAEDKEDLWDIVHEIFFYDKSLFAMLRHFPKDKDFEWLQQRCMDIIKSTMFNESLTEANYGGAYDIDPEMFWTKDDLIEFSDAVCEKLADKFGYQYDIADVGAENNNDMYITIMDTTHDIEADVSFRIKMSRIRSPRDLMKYLDTVVSQFVKKFEEEYQYYNFDESLTEDADASYTRAYRQSKKESKRFSDEVKKGKAWDEVLVKLGYECVDPNCTLWEKEVDGGNSIVFSFENFGENISDSDVECYVVDKNGNVPTGFNSSVVRFNESLTEDYGESDFSVEMYELDEDTLDNKALLDTIPVSIEEVKKYLGKSFDTYIKGVTKEHIEKAGGIPTTWSIGRVINGIAEKKFLNSDKNNANIIHHSGDIITVNNIGLFPSGIKNLSKKLGKLLLPKRENLKESMSEIMDDFAYARRNWDRIGTGISLDDALEEYNAQYGKEGFYARPLYSESEWNRMVGMFKDKEFWESLNEDVDDEADFDTESDFSDGVIEEGVHDDMSKEELYVLATEEADSDANRLRDGWQRYDDKSVSELLGVLGYISDDPNSVYMYKELGYGFASVFNLEPFDGGKDYVEYFVVDEDNRIPRGFTKTRLMLDADVESMTEDIDDEIDLDYETGFSDGGVEEGGTFSEDGREWSWVERIAGPIHLDFDNWAVWSARDWGYIQEKIRPILLNKEELTVETLTKIYDEAEVAYFVVDEDTGFIDWGPVESQTEAQDFLNGKVEDWENEDEYDESLKESKDLKEWWTVDLDYEDIGSYGYTYEVDGEDVVDYLTEMLYDGGEYPDFLEDKSDGEISAWLDDEENYPKFRDWVEENFDALFKKYEYKILEHFEDEATMKYFDEHEDDDWGYGSDNGSGMTDRDFL